MKLIKLLSGEIWRATKTEENGLTILSILFILSYPLFFVYFLFVAGGYYLGELIKK